MPVARNDAALQFMASRRSVPPKLMTAPVPEGEALDALLRVALRVPDHGKLQPWRLVVLNRSALDRLAAPLEAGMRARNADEAAIAKAQNALRSPLIVAVIASPVDSDRIPLWEQQLSVGAVCFALVSAALADGWGASWLTGALAEPSFAAENLGLAPGESVAGLIHIGTYNGPDVPDRPRPDLADRVTVL